jgi:hypothetical protein
LPRVLTEDYPPNPVDLLGAQGGWQQKQARSEYHQLLAHKEATPPNVLRLSCKARLVMLA